MKTLNEGKNYAKPLTKVRPLESESILFDASAPTLPVVDNQEEENEWPIDPDTQKPYSPW